MLTSINVEHTVHSRERFAMKISLKILSIAILTIGVESSLMSHDAQQTAPTLRLSALHECVRAHLPVTALASPATSVIADVNKHATFVDTAYREVTQVLRLKCGRHKDIVFKPNGGLGDRMRGLATTFYLALTMHAGFGHVWHHPFGIDTFFDVGQFETDPGHAGARGIDIVNRYDYIDTSDYHADLESNNRSVVLTTNTFQWLQVVRHPVAARVADMYGLSGLTRQQLFRLATAVVLRRNKPFLSDAVQRVLAEMGRGPFGEGAIHDSSPTLVGVQLRTGGVGEPWAEKLGDGTPRIRHPVSATHCFVDALKLQCAERRACHVFLTSDSRAAAASFIDQVRYTLPAIQVTETPGHALHPEFREGVSSNATDPHGAWLKTLVDWIVLSRMDVLLMSHSSYSWTAAWAGSVPVVRKLKWRTERPCSWDDFDVCSSTAPFI